MSLTRKHYPFSEFEPRWQRHWLETQAFRAKNPGEPGFPVSYTHLTLPTNREV